MAITPTDFEKIWSSNASTPAYTFSDSDYLEGWDFVGNLPPTRAQWNAIQKRTDEKMKYVFENFGAPLMASTVAEMTLQNRVYVYTGSEVGYTAGDWYYYDAGTSTWVDGGVYNAVAIVTDTTLTQAGVPADAKATGDAISLKADASIVPSIDPTLTISGAGADAKVVGDKINALTDAVATEETTTETVDIWSSITWTDGYYISANGTKVASASYKYSSMFPVSAGDVLEFANTSRQIRFITAYSDESTAVESAGTNSGVYTYTVPNGINYLVITILATYSNLVLNLTHTETTLHNNLEDDVDAVNDRLTNFENDIGSNKSFIVVNSSRPTVSSGYYWSGVHSSTSYYYVHLTGLKKDDVVYITLGEGITKIKVRFTDAYNGNVRNDGASVNGDIQTYTVPENVDNIYCSFSVTYTTNITANIRTTETDFILNETVSQNAFVNTFNLSAGNTYSASKNLQDISGFRISFFAKVGVFSGETRIGKAETETYGGAIGFDTTNLYEYLGNITTPTRTQAHGLTIKDYIGLVIDVHYNGETVITLSTNGGRYTWTVPYWRSQYGVLSVYSASALTDCVLSYTCEGILKETWLYGDSYFANTSNIRWTAYLVSSGYTNYLLNAYPGRGSATAVLSLKTDLELGKIPKRIIWCLGMNDPDEIDQPNEAWLNTIGEVMGICTKNNIELVLATIPNVPSLSNEQKNAYVKASGYRYIPFASAISEDESSTWYDGMLETIPGEGYGIHPTEQGALCLFNCAVSAVPELLW